jgi:hypothetical protein
VLAERSRSAPIAFRNPSIASANRVLLTVPVFFAPSPLGEHEPRCPPCQQLLIAQGVTGFNKSKRVLLKESWVRAFSEEMILPTKPKDPLVQLVLTVLSCTAGTARTS